MNKILLSTATAFILSLTACSSHAPEKRVHRILTDRIQTLAVAESCTGGTIAARFTALPGASAYFKCGVVAYSLDTKQEILQISCDTIARYGAVSEQVVPAHALSLERQQRANELTAVLGGLVDRGVARFATGEIELNDETYAAWLSELKAAGSDELVAMYAEN